MNPIQSALFFAATYAVLSRVFTETKRKAWIIATTSSGALTIISFIQLTKLIRGTESLAVRETYYIDDPLSNYAANLFFGSLIADLAIGHFFYRSEMKLLDGYIHHCVYIVFLFHIVRNGLQNGMVYGFLEELPTFVRGFGAMIPSCRNDEVFRNTFFATRIAWHIVFVSYQYKCLDNPVVLVIGPIGLCAHLFWGMKLLRPKKTRAISGREAVGYAKFSEAMPLGVANENT
jgi:hypothetical protein